MPEQSASAAEKSELTLAVSHSTTTTTTTQHLTLIQELLSFIAGRRKNSMKFAAPCFDFVFVLFQGSFQNVKS